MRKTRHKTQCSEVTVTAQESTVSLRKQGWEGFANKWVLNSVTASEKKEQRVVSHCVKFSDSTAEIRRTCYYDDDEF